MVLLVPHAAVMVISPESPRSMDAGHLPRCSVWTRASPWFLHVSQMLTIGWCSFQLDVGTKDGFACLAGTPSRRSKRMDELQEIPASLGVA